MRAAMTEDHEILLIRRGLAYHQKCSLCAVSNEAARAFMAEQQRRQNRLYSDNSRWHPGRGTWCEGGVNPWKVWPLSANSREVMPRA